MTTQINNPNISDTATDTPQDDIAALKETFSIPQWHYVDIAREKTLSEMLKRWPLFSELAEQGDDVCP